MLSSKVENSQQQSFRRKPESRHFEVLRKHWIPVFTGMTTFDEVVSFEATGICGYLCPPGSINRNRALLFLHRPSNVDDGDTFRGIAAALNEIAAGMPILFPAHPRTRKMMEKFQINFSENIKPGILRASKPYPR